VQIAAIHRLSTRQRTGEEVAARGQRFLMLKDSRDPTATPASMVVAEHWVRGVEAACKVIRPKVGRNQDAILFQLANICSTNLRS